MSWSKTQDARHSHHLENQFSTSFPKPLVDLCWNLLCSNRTAPGWKCAIIVVIGNPRWLPQAPYWKSVLDIFLQTTRWIKLRSQVQPPPRSATFFPGDWSWNIFYVHSLPSSNSRRAVVIFWQKNVHNTGQPLRGGLSLSSKGVVR